MPQKIHVGVLALQGAFREHLHLFDSASRLAHLADTADWSFSEVRTAEQLARCDALVIPGGESTTMALVAERSGLLEPLRDFVKVKRRPTWGTCAGLILLSESANKIKKGGQDLIGGLDVRVNRNHFGRQTESFETDLQLPFLANGPDAERPFRTIFIRAPVVEKILPVVQGEQKGEAARDDTITAPAREAESAEAKESTGRPVEVLARLAGRRARLAEMNVEVEPENHDGDIVAVRQGNVFGCSFHPELTQDSRIHAWWLEQVRSSMLTTS